MGSSSSATGIELHVENHVFVQQLKK